MIDDDKDILKTWDSFLSRKGYAVDLAETGAAAIEKCQEKSFNLAIIDIVLPDMQGTKLLIDLKDTTPKMRKIIATGYSSLENAVEALNRGADAYVMKPVDPQELLNVIEGQLSKQEKESVITNQKIADYIKTRKADFVEVVKQSLNSLLGESATQSTIYHLGGEEALRDPDVFEEKLRSLFNIGAESILKHILLNLEKSEKAK